MILKIINRHRPVDDFIGARNMDKKITDQLPSYVENRRNSAEEHRSRVNQE
jgi:hypothetical protein